MSCSILFEHWRAVSDPKRGSGLAWFLGNEFCKRFYRSHGLVPWVINHHDLGYYGIQLGFLKCGKRPDPGEAMGRLTMGGNVENWRNGSPGDHGFNAIDSLGSGMPTGQIMASAIAHMGVPVTPSESHVGCRHHRWGSSYVLLFEIATILRLRHDQEHFNVLNNPDHFSGMVRELDSKYDMREHPGGFLLENNGKTILIAGDGRILDGTGRNLWKEYMKGASADHLAGLLWLELGSGS